MSEFTYFCKSKKWYVNYVRENYEKYAICIVFLFLVTFSSLISNFRKHLYFFFNLLFFYFLKISIQTSSSIHPYLINTFLKRRCRENIECEFFKRFKWSLDIFSIIYLFIYLFILKSNNLKVFFHIICIL